MFNLPIQMLLQTLSFGCALLILEKNIYVDETSLNVIWLLKTAHSKCKSMVTDGDVSWMVDLKWNLWEQLVESSGVAYRERRGLDCRGMGG